MIGGLFKKILGKPEEKQNAGSKLALKFREKSQKFANFLNDSLETAKQEYYSIKEKSKNLQKTNYELGLKHLEDGNISEAIFRFRIVKKFWPDLLEANYYLAYCLFLKDRKFEAKKLLEEFIKRNPNVDDKTILLLENINAGLEQENKSIND